MNVCFCLYECVLCTCFMHIYMYVWYVCDVCVMYVCDVSVCYVCVLCIVCVLYMCYVCVLCMCVVYVFDLCGLCMCYIYMCVLCVCHVYVCVQSTERTERLPSCTSARRWPVCLPSATSCVVAFRLPPLTLPPSARVSMHCP